MRLTRLVTVSFAAILAVAGCKKQSSDTDAIRAGIVEHLTSLKTLNLSAMDIHVTSVDIQGNQAQARVEFRPKAGAPPGAGMQVSYALEKEKGDWVVTKTLATGGVIEHPAPGTNPHSQLNQTGTPGIVGPPMFRDLLHGDTTKLGGSLPP
jgi:hypothetical protein